jgi:hypothetical protein
MIQFRRGKTKNWRNSATPLADGQPGYDRDKHKIKIGDGKTKWKELPYASGLSSEEILSSEADAKVKNKLDREDTTIITYGTDAPDKNTIGQVYLQHYEAAPETDYIVSTGINKGWAYQKFKSGIAKCCGTFELTTQLQVAIGSDLLYQSNNSLKEIEYPFTFKEKPSEVATVQSPGNLVWLAASKGLNTTKRSATYSIIGVDKEANAAKYYISLQVEGLWK